MRKFVHILLLITTCLLADAQTANYSRRMIESQGEAWTSGKSWDYVSGLVSEAVLKASEQYPSEAWATKAYSWAKTFADNSIGKSKMFNDDGSFNKYKKGSIDEVASGKVFFELYRHEVQNGNDADAAKYKSCAETLYRYFTTEYNRIQKGDAAGGFWHKDSYPNQMWLDGLFMGAAFCAEYLATFAPDDELAWEDVEKQFVIIHRHTFDREKKLNYHGWSADPKNKNSFWANQDETSAYYGCSKEFWGRGMGWYFAALVDVIEYRGAGKCPQLVSIVNDVAEGLAARQDAVAGVWYQLLQYDATFFQQKGTTQKYNYLEASASSMFTYGFLKALRLGIIDQTRYTSVAQRAFSGLVSTFITEKNGVISINKICRSAGLGPSNKPERDGSAYYYLFGSDAKDIVSNEGKGIGSFILAALEYEKFEAQSNAVTPATADFSRHTDKAYDLSGRRTSVQSRHGEKRVVIYNGRKVLR